jgi:flagellar biogenesis protein FliO
VKRFPILPLRVGGTRSPGRTVALAVIWIAALLGAAVFLRAAPAADVAPASVSGEEGAPPPAGQGSFLETALRWAAATVVTLALALAALPLLRRRTAKGAAAPVAVRHQVSLGRGISVVLLETGRGFLLVGVGPDGVTRLREFRGEEAQEMRETIPAGAASRFGTLLSGLTSREAGRT